jgi:hypothetical protein
MTMQRLRSASALGVLFSAVAACSPTPSNTDAAVPDSGGSDGSTAMEAGPAGDAGACTRGAIITPLPDPEMICAGFTAAPCPGETGAFCPRFVDNNPMNPKFVLTQIDIQRPASLLPNTTVGRLLNTSIRNAVFSWGIDVDFSMMRVRTGTLSQPIMRRPGTGYYAEMFRFVMGAAPVMPGMTADRWDPVVSPLTVMGDTVSAAMPVPIVTIPVYDENNRANLLTELPLRDARIFDMRLTANRNCIGTAQTAFNSCGPNNNRWNTAEGDPDAGMQTPNGILEAKLTVEDTLRVQVVSLSMPLCNIIARVNCRDMMGQPVDPTTFTIPPDTTVMVGGVAKPAWTLRAHIAGVAANITN